ncbi:hypothetical protein [Deinococcus sp. SL84]|uniref:hypothetical protein n=1 Tax=Deinococcus sp. SL84 TaxID=2994663 RepID=UPI0022739161|nr:hypothetical protein [Deinococcus sp. SL84]MCY1704401.1 hypothetical protein [Deinococcus sp. SL84]
MRLIPPPLYPELKRQWPRLLTEDMHAPERLRPELAPLQAWSQSGDDLAFFREQETRGSWHRVYKVGLIREGILYHWNSALGRVQPHPDQDWELRLPLDGLQKSHFGIISAVSEGLFGGREYQLALDSSEAADLRRLFDTRKARWLRVGRWARPSLMVGGFLALLAVGVGYQAWVLMSVPGLVFGIGSALAAFALMHWHSREALRLIRAYEQGNAKHGLYASPTDSDWKDALNALIIERWHPPRLGLEAAPDPPPEAALPSAEQVQRETLEEMLSELEQLSPQTPEEAALLEGHRTSLQRAVAARQATQHPLKPALKDTVAYQQAYLREIGEHL